MNPRSSVKDLAIEIVNVSQKHIAQHHAQLSQHAHIPPPLPAPLAPPPAPPAPTPAPAPLVPSQPQAQAHSYVAAAAPVTTMANTGATRHQQVVPVILNPIPEVATSSDAGVRSAAEALSSRSNAHETPSNSSTEKAADDVELLSDIVPAKVESPIVLYSGENDGCVLSPISTDTSGGESDLSCTYETVESESDAPAACAKGKLSFVARSAEDKSLLSSAGSSISSSTPCLLGPLGSVSAMSPEDMKPKQSMSSSSSSDSHQSGKREHVFDMEVKGDDAPSQQPPLPKPSASPQTSSATHPAKHLYTPELLQQAHTLPGASPPSSHAECSDESAAEHAAAAASSVSTSSPCKSHAAKESHSSAVSAEDSEELEAISSSSTFAYTPSNASPSHESPSHPQRPNMNGVSPSGSACDENTPPTIPPHHASTSDSSSCTSTSASIPSPTVPGSSSSIPPAVSDQKSNHSPEPAAAAASTTPVTLTSAAAAAPSSLLSHSSSTTSNATAAVASPPAVHHHASSQLISYRPHNASSLAHQKPHMMLHPVPPMPMQPEPHAEVGLSRIADMLAANRTLESLTITAFSHVYQAFARDMGVALQKTPRALLELKLHLPLGTSGCMCVVDSLKLNSKLQSIKLSSGVYC